jgi:uncharacterized protein YlzI (FlbEa/FlbD family)
MIVDKNKELYIYKTVGWDEMDKEKIEDILNEVVEYRKKLTISSQE